MKKLTLKDGTEIDVLDDSGVGNLRIPVQDFADADTLAAKLTKENMEEITLGVQIFHEVNPVAMSVVKQDGEMIMSVYCQESLQDVIQNEIDNYTEMLIIEGVIS